MQSTQLRALCVALALAPTAQAAEADPLEKVFKMLDELRGKIIQEGEATAKTYRKMYDWCDDTNQEKNFEISDLKSKKGDLEATIKQKTSTGDAASQEIETLAASVAKDQKELKEATAVREEEAELFATSEADLEATIDTLDRAIGVIEKKGAAFVQTARMENSLAALRAIAEAAFFSAADKERLVALVQAKQSSDDEAAVGAPQGAGYQKKSGGVVELLEDLKDEAEQQLSDVRKAETAAAHNFAKVKQSLEDSIAADTAGGEEAKAVMAAAAEAVSDANGELANTVKTLKETTEALEVAHADCMQAAVDHEKSVTSRTEELNVITEAKKILKEATGGALIEQSVSFLQVGSEEGSEVLGMVKRLAKRHRTGALAQLASQITAVVRFSAKRGTDPFSKIKNLIEGLITKLQKEAAEEAEEQGWCTEQMTKTNAKQAELEEDSEKLTARIDKATSKSIDLKKEADTIQAELAEIVRSQKETLEIRTAEHKDFVDAQEVLKSGVEGVRKALQVLRNYYGGSSAAALLQSSANLGSVMHEPHEGAGGSIISILEVCESDFEEGLQKVETEEADAQSEYDKISRENEMTKASKEQDLKYKSQAATKLDKAVSDLKKDLATESDELAAVNKYLLEVKARCVAKPDPYEAQKAKRDAEIKGLKDALETLETETALVQRQGRARRTKFLRH